MGRVLVLGSILVVLAGCGEVLSFVDEPWDGPPRIAQRAADPRGEAAMLHEQAMLAVEQGRLDEARALYARALRLWRRAGDVDGELATMVGLAVLDFRGGRAASARRALEEALGRARVRGSFGVEQQAGILNLLAQMDREEGDFATARRRFEASLALFTRIGDAEKISVVSELLDDLTLVERTAAARKAYPGIVASGGFVVSRVTPGGQAGRAGVRVGDVLSRYDGVQLDGDPEALGRLVLGAAVDKVVVIEGLRGAERVVFEVHGGPLGIVALGLLPVSGAGPAAEGGAAVGRRGDGVGRWLAAE